jgi:hypothetical protein
VLINLSNHPIAEWSEKQLKQAITQYGEVIDISFPAIPPEADSDEVRQLALDVVSSICSKHINEKFTVHIMGELTFVYMAVQEFHKKGIECVASTSQRKVLSLANGEKVSQFHFIRFREYQSSPIFYHP